MAPPPPSTAASLFALCRELVDAISAGVALSPGGPIPDGFVSPGNPAFDCPPMIAVHAGGPQQADTLPLAPPLQPGDRDVVGSVNLVVVTATIIRCTPIATQAAGRAMLPSTAKLEDSAAEILGDVWAVWNHLATMKRTELLFAPTHRKMFFDGAVAVPTSGGAAGWQMPFKVQLDGYRTAP